MTRAFALFALILPCTTSAAPPVAPLDGPGATRLLVGPLPAGAPATPREAQPKKSDPDTVEGGLQEVELWLPGGEAAVLRLDLETGLVEATLPTLPLHADAEAAVALVPAWMQPQLALTLSRLEEGRQQEIAALLADYADHPALDELAYSIAATSPEELSMSWQYGLLEVLEANATSIYDIDPYVPFADLVELEDGSTTVEYHHDGGSYTVDKEIYYRYVVNPKLDMELPLFMDPESYSISDPPRGVHWRDWIFFSALADGTWDYRTHWLQEEPYEVEDGDLWSMTAMGWLHDFQVDPLVVLVDPEDRPVLVEMDWGAGTVLATSVDLTAAWSAFDIEDLVLNIAWYVQRRDLLEADETTLVLYDDPDAVSVFPQLLQDAGLPVETWDLSEGMPALSGYEKLIIPSTLGADGLAVVYAEDAVATIESFVSGGGTLLIETDADLGASGDYPCGFSASTDVDNLTPHFVGHPVLSESLAGIDSLWDGVRYDSLSGERALADATSAVDAIGWFVTQNMFDNVSEYAGTHSDYDGERSVWPQRIMHNHFGNCGECQDMITAAARAAMIPTMNVWSMEDHVWNEFFFEDGWHAWQVDWSDGPTRIDNGGVGADSTYGGGKEVSAIMGFHQNGYIADEHVALYTDTIDVGVTVTDADGQPVPGAMVLVAVENYYYDSFLDQAAWVHTDQLGQVEITLGDNRNFWFMAAADLGGEDVWAPYSIPDIQSGSYPNWFLTGEAGDPHLWAEDAVAGSAHQIDIQLDGRVGKPVATEGGVSGSWGAEGALDLRLDSTLLDVRAGHTFLGWYSELGYAYGGGMIQPLDEPGTVDLYVVDADNYALFQAGEAFDALALQEGAEGSWSFPAVSTDAAELYLLVSNKGSPRHVHHGTIALDWHSTHTLPDDEGGGGCGCSTHPRRTPTALLGLLAVLGLAVRRRR
jgi:MYXO-CTERM domain-containing protein